MEFSQFLAAAVLILIFLCIGYAIGKRAAKNQHDDEIPAIRDDAIKKSRAVLAGQFSEQIAPYLPDFPYKPTEARFLGKPIDFVVFKGMDEKNIDEVVFVEVKSGKNELNVSQKSLRHAIENKRIAWAEYRIPEEVTRSKQ